MLPKQNVPTTSQSSFSDWNEHRVVLIAMANHLLGRDLKGKLSASDLVQDTLLEAFQTANTSRIEQLANKHSMLRWLTTILRNNIRDSGRAFRSAKKRSISREVSAPANLNYVSTEITHRDELRDFERAAQVQQLIGQLPAAHQQIIRWRFLDELSYRQIADRVSRSEDAIRMMVQRSLKRLAHELTINDRSTIC